jgi:hypothetical protein
MEGVRIAGVVVAMLFALYGVYRYQSSGGRNRRSLFWALVIAVGVALVSIVPQIADGFARLFSIQDRAFAILAFAVLLLFGLFLYLLGQAEANRRKTRDGIIALAVQRYRDQYGNKDGTARHEAGKVMVMVPAYNEGKNIGDVLRRVPDEILGYPTKTVVLVDGATDDTEAVALRMGVPTAALATRLGKGDVMRVGFEIARLETPEMVITLDSDGQYKPEEIEDVVRPVHEGKADFVIGSRFLGFYEESGSIRHAGVVFFSRLVSVLIGRRITDCTSGLRAIRGTGAAKLDLREEQFETNEVLLEAHRNRLRITEVPCSMLKRAEGKSKKPKRLRYPMGVMWVIVRTWLR